MPITFTDFKRPDPEIVYEPIDDDDPVIVKSAACCTCLGSTQQICNPEQTTGTFWTTFTTTVLVSGAI